MLIACEGSCSCWDVGQPSVSDDFGLRKKGFDLPPFHVGGLDLPVGTGNTSWCIVCVCQHNPPLAMRYYELWRSEWFRDRREDTVLQMQHVLDRVERAELGGCV